MSLSDVEHVEVAMILRRLLDNRADHEGRDAARAWLVEHWPRFTLYRQTVARGAKPLSLKLSAGQLILLSRAARSGECEVVGSEAASARALEDRQLATVNGCTIKLTLWGRAVAARLVSTRRGAPVIVPTETEMPSGFRQILARLELISHGTTQSWSPSHGGEKEVAFPPGESKPPHVRWRERWEKATDEDGRMAAWSGARNELESLTTRHITEVPVESEEQLAKRIVTDGEGWTVEEVAQRMRCTTTFVRRARLKDGRDIGTGMKPEEMIEDLVVKRERARELAERGLTERQIAMHTGLSKTTVRRVLGKAA
jgi:hypothetical protein